MKSILSRAEQLLAHDKYNNHAEIDVIRQELQRFLADYIIYNTEDYSLSADVDKDLVLTMKVVVKNFKHFGIT
jgi:hypothetical protein